MAVMAHELAHVRRRHMFWMAASLVAAGLALAFMVDPLVGEARDWIVTAGGDYESMQRKVEWVDVAAMGVVLLGTLGCFGWVSRRFERQADAFAAVELSRSSKEDRQPVLQPEAVDAMSSALGAVASLGGVNPKRRSWRHGSIASRQRHLRSLEGLQADRLPIDRVVHWINGVSAAVIVLGIVIGTWDLVLQATAEEVPVTRLTQAE
ncbi:MAG: M48 family metalloprotease, partial [Phycisphaerales bacterium]|nr:M48 family metalloprotease [Phycisphaerales bacterium]